MVWGEGKSQTAASVNRASHAMQVQWHRATERFVAVLGAARAPLHPLPPLPQLPDHLEGVGLPRPRHLQRHQLPENHAHRIHILCPKDSQCANLSTCPAAASPLGASQATLRARLHPQCCMHACHPHLRSLFCCSALTEAKVARPPCSTSGLSQRGLVAARLVDASGSVPSITCGRGGKVTILPASGSAAHIAARCRKLPHCCTANQNCCIRPCTAGHLCQFVVRNPGMPVCTGGKRSMRKSVQSESHFSFSFSF